MRKRVNVGSPEFDRIILDAGFQIRHWTATLDISEIELAAAIHEVGPSAAKVREFLRARRPGSRA